MSYSRWLGSRWYTFWSTSSDYGKDAQVFEICGCRHFTYGELRDNFASCLALAAAKDGCEDKREIEELAGYMREFMADVEEVFSEERIRKAEELKEKIDVGSVFKWSDGKSYYTVLSGECFEVPGDGGVQWVESDDELKMERVEKIHTIVGWMELKDRGVGRYLEFYESGLDKASRRVTEKNDE